MGIDLAIVRNPLTYQEMPSRRQYATYTLVIWIPSAVFGIALPMLWHNLCPPECTFIQILTTSFLKYGFLPFFVMLAFPMTALYTRVLIIAKKHLLTITSCAFQPPEPPPDPQEVVGQTDGNACIKGQIKILRACFLVFATFYISWLPFLVILGIQLYSGQLEQASPLSMARSLTMCLIPINSLANPLI